MAKNALVDVASVRARVHAARRFASEAPHLIAYAVAGIQRLVFTSSRQAGIRAASDIVIAFDEWSSQRQGAVFARGGRGLLLASRQACPEVERQLRNEFERLTTDASLSVVSVPFDPSCEHQSLRWLWAVAGARKDASPPPHTPLPKTTGRELCVSCHVSDGTVKASKYIPPDPGLEDARICQSCQSLFERDRQRGHEINANRNLSAVAAKGRIACLSADGNNMGQLFQDLPTLEALAAVSDIVGQAFTGAIETARGAVGDDRLVAPVTGGDDVHAFFDPCALDTIVTTLAQTVRARIDSAAQGLDDLAPGVSAEVSRVGIGLGVVIAHEKFPALRLLDRAQLAEAQAKAHCHRVPLRSGAQVHVLGSGCDSADGEPDTYAGDKPVDLETPTGWQSFMHHARALRRVASSQRAAMRVAARQLAGERRELENLFRYQVARSSDWKRYFETIEVDWRLPADLQNAMPTERLYALADIELEKPGSASSALGSGAAIEGVAASPREEAV